MSRIDRETTNELNALDAHIQTRNEYEQIWTTNDEYEDTRQHGPNMANTQHNHDAHNGTASGNHRDTPLSHDKHRDDTTNGIRRTNSCWPPTGGCQSCGFHPQQRAGDMCIALVRICSSCGVMGHMERMCEKKPELNTIEPAIHTGLDSSIGKTDKVVEMSPSDDQTGHTDSGREMHFPQDTTSDVQSNNEERHDTGPTALDDNNRQH